MKLASLDQIKNRFFSETGMHTAQRRLLKLLNAQYIRKLKFFTDDFGLKSIYSISKKGEKLCKNIDVLSYERKNSSSQAPFHDLALVDIRLALEANFPSATFWSENALKNLVIQPERHRGLEALARAHSDGGLCLGTHDSNSDLVIGVEYEANQKSRERINGRIATYYSEERIEVVLFFAASHEVIRSVKNAERRYMKSQSPKLYFATFQNFISNQSKCIYENCLGQTFEMNMNEDGIVWIAN